jgi:hypothetical protein
MMIVCVRCRSFFHPKKNGVCVEEGMPQGTTWVPYKLWLADSLECRKCKTEIIAGFGATPVSEHYNLEYGRFKAALNPYVFVEDCV